MSLLDRTLCCAVGLHRRCSGSALVRDVATALQALCGCSHHEPPQPWEWLQVRDHVNQNVNGWIPRWVAELLGVDCSPLDRTVTSPIWGRPTQGTVWFNREQSAAFRQTKWWVTDEQFQSCS